MRCSKCGYVSFDYLDRCKSCGEDLVPAKIKLNIYAKQPKLVAGDDGFVMGKVGSSQTSFLEENTAGATAPDDSLESFDFEDKNA